MPRVNRRLRETADNGWSEAHREYLVEGHAFAWLFNPDDPRKFDRDTPEGLDEMREAWNELRDELLPAYIAENPGARCWAWWQFDSREPLRVIEGTEDHESGFPAWRFLPGRTEAQLEVEWPPVLAWLWEEHLAGRSQREMYFGRPGTHRFECKYEDERDYLERLNLLEPAERAALERLDAEAAP